MVVRSECPGRVHRRHGGLNQVRLRAAQRQCADSRKAAVDAVNFVFIINATTHNQLRRLRRRDRARLATAPIRVVSTPVRIGLIQLIGEGRINSRKALALNGCYVEGTTLGDGDYLAVCDRRRVGPEILGFGTQQSALMPVSGTYRCGGNSVPSRAVLVCETANEEVRPRRRTASDRPSRDGRDARATRTALPVVPRRNLPEGW